MVTRFLGSAQSPMINGLVENHYNPWSADQRKEDPNYFKVLARQHKPKVMWIGCSDARLAIYQKMGLPLGEVFICRNIANQTNHTSARAAVSYAVKVLGVKQIIVCGHYKCGGIKGALNRSQISDPSLHRWLEPIERLAIAHQDILNSLGPRKKPQRLSELNVWDQVSRIGRMRCVQEAWADGAKLAVDGLVFDMGQGLLIGAGSVSSREQWLEYRQAPQPLVTLT